MASRQMSWAEARKGVERLGRRIIEERQESEIKVWGIPRGGGYVAALLDGTDTVRLDGKTVPLCHIYAVERPEDATVAVDDIIDTGRTAEGVKERYGLDTYALVDRKREPGRWSDRWIIFPWEGESGQEDDSRHAVTRMLQLIGENPQRPGLLDTPRRVSESWKELYEGYNYTKADLTAMLTRFDGPLVPVTVGGISFVSTCEHHLMPYRGTVDIGYMPEGGVIGLSKLPRMVQLLARRLTIQEQLTQDIVDVLRPVVRSACVRVEARHACLSDRGVKDTGVSAVTVSHTEAGVSTVY